MTLARLAAIGHDLVITSAHYGARPSHAEWQGRPCCVSGPKLVGGVQYPGLVQLTGYGGVGGLKGVNCRHSIGPYYPGVTELPDLSFPRESGHFWDDVGGVLRGHAAPARAGAARARDQARDSGHGAGRHRAGDAPLRAEAPAPSAASSRRCGSTARRAASCATTRARRPTAWARSPGRWRAAAKAKAAGATGTRRARERIDALTSGALAGVRFSAPPTYNGRIRTPGLTKVGYDGDGRKYAGPVYIGKQAKPGDASSSSTRSCIEELEARIWLNRHGSERYWHLNSAGDDERHAYIQKIIDRYVRNEGHIANKIEDISRRSARRDESADRRAGRMRRIVPLPMESGTFTVPPGRDEIRAHKLFDPPACTRWRGFEHAF